MAKINETTKITSKNILVVEGSDEEKFFEALFSVEKIECIQILNVEGKYNFKSKVIALSKLSGFDEIEKLGLILDADNNADSTFQKITDVLKAIPLEAPPEKHIFYGQKPAIGVYIMPDYKETGMLEDLCLEAVKDEPAMVCVKAFEEKVTGLENPPRNLTKSKAHVYLVSMPEFCCQLGIGAQKSYWKFESGVYDVLKQFLQNFNAS